MWKKGQLAKRQIQIDNAALINKKNFTDHLKAVL